MGMLKDKVSAISSLALKFFSKRKGILRRIREVDFAIVDKDLLL
jgi:hypothetical protein